MKEIWKDIKGYDGLYQVSNLGRVRSFKRNKKIPKVLKLINRLGYRQLTLYDKGSKTMKVHHLVANAFIKNEHNYIEINHINGIKSDNRVENLEWCNRSKNIKHSYDIGLRKPKIDVLNEARLKSIKKIQKPITLLDEYNNEYHFDSQVKASEYLQSIGFEKSNKSNISALYRGIRKTHCGFKIKK